jgi:hypothetical protein
MDANPAGSYDSAEAVARAFLAALDDGRWSDAAALVHPQTREAFKSWWIDHLQRERHTPPQVDPETIFASPAELLGTADAAEAAELPSEELVARFAEAVQPGNLHRQRDGSAVAPIRVARTLLDSALDKSGGVFVRYRSEAWHGQVRNEATAGVYVLELIRMDDRWYVRDGDLGAGGVGHLVPSPPG